MILRSIEFKEKFLTKRDKDTILKLKFDPNVQYITGPNGYGKTTIFNLIYQMILKDDIDQDLKDCVGAIKLETSQGDITFDHINGLQKQLACFPQIRYKKQMCEGFDPNPEDVQLILGCEELMELIGDYCEKREELLVDVNTGKLMLRNIKTGSIFPIKSAPTSLQNIIMMFLFALQTQKGDILLLEHPEEHLHIALQLELMPKLEKICRGQMLVTTHSSQIFQHVGFSATKDLYMLMDRKNENNNK